MTNADWRRSRWLGRAVRRACAYRSGRASLLLSALRPRYGVPVPTVSVYDVAAEMRSRLPGIGTKKLHKLLYYCQGHHLATFGQPLFTETISAWDMGPVVGSLWFQEKQDGIKEASSELAEAALNTLGYVVSRYGALTARDLEHLTHSEAPWQCPGRKRILVVRRGQAPRSMYAPSLRTSATRRWVRKTATRFYLTRTMLQLG